MRTQPKGLALAAALAISACQGERPPLWSMDEDRTRAAFFEGGSTVVVDRSIRSYSLPAFGLNLGGFSGFYYPYPAFGCCPRSGPAFIPGRPRVGWRGPFLPKRSMTAPLPVPPGTAPGWRAAPPPGSRGIPPLAPPRVGR